MRTNKTLRIASVLLIAVLMTTCIIGGTFAKYTSEVATATSTAEVAKWNVTTNVTDVNDTVDGIQFNLWGTAGLKDTKNNGDAETPDYTEDDVVAGKIAPGTKGAFSFTITNASDVTAEGKVVLTIGNTSNIPVNFYTDEAMTQSLTITENVATISGLTMAKSGGTAEVTIYWQWAFEGNDGDTALGTAATAPAITVSAVISAEQVD